MLESVSDAWLWLAAASSAAFSGIADAKALPPPLSANTVPPPASASTAAAASTKPQRRLGRIATSSKSRLEKSTLLVTGAKLCEGREALGAAGMTDDCKRAAGWVGISGRRSGMGG